jgi:hypothetical protein
VKERLGVGRAAAFALALAAACTPDIGHDAVPEAMEFDTQALPPRVPQPTGLVVNPLTGHIDFALAGTPLPEDCSTPGPLSPAECGFNHYLESLDGFPTVTPAAAPATAGLAPNTLTFGQNVVVLATREPSRVPDVVLGFDPAGRQLVVLPQPSWSIGELYWIAVRGYASGVRANSGAEVIGSPTMALLKQDEPLPCGARTPAELDPECPALRLLAQNQPESAAVKSLFTLEAIRSAYNAAGVWQRMAAAGLPKEEIAVLWGFPIHSSSVAEIDPATGLLPRVVSENEIRIGVQGPVDPATVSAFVVREQPGSVVLMDLSAAASGDLVSGFPRIQAHYDGGEIVITSNAAFSAGHQYGIFMTRALRDPTGASLVPAPISVLLTSRAPLTDDAGKSAISTVADTDAATLEAGRQQLATLFDNPVFAPLTGIAREDLVYCFAFGFEAP